MLFLVLLFPSIIYVILSSGKHSFLHRPVFGPKTVNEAGDTNYYTVPAFSFTRCNGEEVSLNDFENVITVVGFYDPFDSLVTSRMSNQMMTLHERFRDNPEFVLISLSSSNDSNSIQEACRIESEFPIVEGKWLLGTLNQDVKEFAISQLFLDKSDSLQCGFNNQQMVLIDKQKRIRSYRDAIQYVETTAMADDMKVVKAEEFISKKTKKREGE